LSKEAGLLKGGQSMIEVSAPGKLILAGEWSVLEKGNPGIVTAVNRRIHVALEESESIRATAVDFHIHDIGGELEGDRFRWQGDLTDDQEKKLLFMRGAIEAALQYLGDFRPFSIRIRGDLASSDRDDDVRKIGFGSSAAAVVSCVAAILAFHGIALSSRQARDLIYKISTAAHYLAQGRIGSAIDVAASTYGGVFVYRRFDPRWLLDSLSSGSSLSEIAAMEWPGLVVEQLEIPDGLDFAVAWTGNPASTSAMVEKMNRWASKHPAEQRKIYGRLAALVNDLIDAWRRNRRETILSLTRQNEVYLRQLGELSGVGIETPELKRLSDIAERHGGAGKLSGAGGGDCGFAFTFDPAASERIRKEWRKHGLFPLDVKMAAEGVG